jgi:maltose O-acetyltransferase
MEIGSDVVVMEHAVLHAEPRSGSHIGSVLTLGHGVHIARFSTIWATVGIHVGAEVLTSDNVALMDCWAPPGQSHHSIVPPPGSPVVIGDGAYLGCGCIICPGVEVGEGAFIGEGAVVMDNVPPHAVVYGNPARVTSVWTEANGWQGRMFGVPA